MAKTYSKEGKASLIFIWILIILLAVGTFYVCKSYTEKSSEIIESDAVEAAFSTTMKKPAGRITAEELAAVEGVDFYAMGESSLAVYYLKGYAELGAEDDASSYMVQATLSYEDFLKDLDLFTGINSFAMQNFLGESVIFDLAKLPADTYKNLETFYTSGITVDNSNLISTHTKLKNLRISDAGLVNIPDISALKDLETVDFSSNEISDISALSTLDNEKITNITIYGNKIEDYSAIAHIDEAKVTKVDPYAEAEVTEEVTEETTEEATEETTEETAEEATEETAEEVTEEATEEATEEVTEEATEEAAE